MNSVQNELTNSTGSDPAKAARQNGSQASLLGHDLDQDR
jgi:hypothetical protein